MTDLIKAWAEGDAQHNIWLDQHSAAARLEGWGIFSCCGSDYGDWQLQRIDEQGALGAPQLDDDEEAWAIVLQGCEAHHVAARTFMRKVNPIEIQMWAELASRRQLDLSCLDEEDRLALVTAALSPPIA